MKNKISMRVLILTALEDTWLLDKPILFLGDWCKLYKRKELWSELDSKTVPYHWDNQKKIVRDYIYLKTVLEKTLLDLSKVLNSIHDVNYTSRYWRLVLGPWLYVFIPIIFDRYSCLNLAINDYNIKEVQTYNFITIEPELSIDYFLQSTEEDLWNQMIITDIISLMKKGLKIKSIKNNKITAKKNNISSRNIFKSIIIKFISLFSKYNKIFIFNTYINYWDLIKTHIKNFQIPNLYEHIIMSENLISNLNRENFKLTLKVENEFESILFKLIVKHIPKSYFENYCFYNKKKINFKWPNNPDVIFTSTSFFNDDFFKIWAGKKIDKKVPFVIYQHGGLYGQSKFSFPEYHEIKVSNYYLTWGWSKNKQTKVKPIGYIKKTIKRNKVLKDKILLVIHNAPRYTITIDSYPGGSQWIYYFEDILTFIERLPERIIKRLVVKLYPYDYGWDVAKRLKDRFPHLKISPKNITFDEHLKNTSLIICGWNSTTFLEGMVSNIPTLAFWNKKYFPLRISAQKEYKLLNKVNIFHNSPIDAAKHLIIIEDKIDLWWGKIDVVNAKNKFLLQYAMINDIPKMLTKFISSHINKH